MINAIGAKGVQQWHSAKRKKKKRHQCINTILLAPLLESTQTKSRQHCLRPLDEVFALGLDAAVAMMPLQASGCHCHGGRKIDTLIEHRYRVTRSRVLVSTSTYVGHTTILRQVPI
jgi:hypothetical protein